MAKLASLRLHLQLWRYSPIGSQANSFLPGRSERGSRGTAVTVMTQTATSTTRTKRTLDPAQLDTNTVFKRSKNVNSQLQSSLFRLPREIRNHIFLFALEKPPFSALLDTSHDDSVDTEPALLRTCHCAYGEALPIFYSRNDWVIKTRRVGGDVGRLDPVSKRLITYQCIPTWLDALSEEKIGLIRNIVVVGSRGSYVDFNGKWRDGERAAFRLKRLSGKVVCRVEEVHVEQQDHEHHRKHQEEKHGQEEAFCSILLVDLLRARMRINMQSSKGNWVWTKDRIHDLAVLL